MITSHVCVCVCVQAISMGMAQILSAKNIVVTVPDARKALALFNSATLPVTDDVPGTHLQVRPPMCVCL